MESIFTYQWEIFIAAEILSVIMLLLFGITRYLLDRKQLSVIFIILFLVLLIMEAILGIWVYQQTGEISNFQIIITIFVVYACTFGITDFKRLDRWMRKIIGKWRSKELLTERDRAIMAKQKNPTYIARKYRYSSIIHLIIFASVQFILWIYGLGGTESILDYITDLSWIENGDYRQSPYANETAFGLSMVWGIIFIVDFIYSWSYTIFPSKEEK
ncbi:MULTISPECIES: hypothetical protein [Oceanobacillus]|uniref:Integral membrane protein n=1 Tax=Oceanobacillus kimchii TaxID=746691 RepID=A0ABQ5TE74_9BACI|nr:MULTISPECIES: hypothetical protein [Oceanobacillus]MBT2653022.1 hypothetical protein [Oceanobacillus sp. ISL-73]OEH53755.1 hypothetical protein AQ616_14840 [Oceanobacillus sp. E9]GLO64655.1 hypothetical protein MACH08_04390 [Oceanobacillus kimchii]